MITQDDLRNEEGDQITLTIKLPQHLLLRIDEAKQKLGLSSRSAAVELILKEVLAD